MIAGLLKTIGALLIAPILFVSSFFSSPEPQPEAPLGAALPQAAALFETSLAAPITSAATSMTLSANSVRGGTTLSGYNCFTIDEGTTQAEFVCGTVSGTAVSSMARGISPDTGTTTVSALQFAHRRGASVKITDFPLIQILKAQNAGQDTFANTLSYGSSVSIATSSSQIPYASWVQNAITSQALLNTGNQTIAGNKTFTGDIAISGTTTMASSTIASTTINYGRVIQAPINGTDITNKTYVDGVAIAGASNANETTKGIVEEATAAETLAGTEVGGTGARLFVTPTKLTAFATSTNLWYFASSTASAFLTTAPTVLDANDFVYVTGSDQRTSCGAGIASAVLSVSNGSATTTLSTATDKDVDSSNCSATAIGFYAIPGSGTYQFSGTYSNQGETRLMVQIMKR